MSDNATLVERLRQRWEEDDLCDEAATRIAELEAALAAYDAGKSDREILAQERIAELEAELKLEQDASRQAMLEVTQRLVRTEIERDDKHRMLHEALDRIAELEAEVARLTAALSPSGE